MPSFDTRTPVVLNLSNHDPSGGSGLQADIETAVSLGCHAATVITAVAARDTQELKDLIANDAVLLIEQARAVLEDMDVAAIKVGLLASIDNIKAVHSILIDYPSIPVVLDPVVQIGSANPNNAEAFYKAISSLLLPLSTVATPSFFEAYELAHEADTIDACAHEILESGCEYVLVSGAQRQDGTLSNSLYGDHRLIRRFDWPTLTNVCHGAGATLASSIACYLAHGLSILDAVQQGQNFTWKSIHAARRLGMGKMIPNRFYWLENAAEKQIASSH